MAVSQFTIYTSGDPFGPGQLTGLTGSLIPILDACLVNGYAGKPAAGWLKPSGSYSGSIACYQQGSGSRLSVLVNDAGANVGAGGKEAWAIGWENLTALTSSNTALYTGSMGSGFGQFPLLTQVYNTAGHVSWRKSNAATAVGRNWIIAADASTFYLWILNGDTAGEYSLGAFGDLYSYSPIDPYKCFVWGKYSDNSPSDLGDLISYAFIPGSPTLSGIRVPFYGFYLARSYSGKGCSIPATRVGDMSAGVFAIFGSIYIVNMVGPLLLSTNPEKFYLKPLQVAETDSGTLRGRIRGLYHVIHPLANFTDGQVFNGGGDYAGKRFRIIETGGSLGFWALEISNTVETN